MVFSRFDKKHKQINEKKKEKSFSDMSEFSRKTKMHRALS